MSILPDREEETGLEMPIFHNEGLKKINQEGENSFGTSTKKEGRAEIVEARQEDIKGVQKGDNNINRRERRR